MNLVQQVRRAFARRSLLATLIGFLLGGFVPVAIYVVVHREGFDPTSAVPSTGLVLGGLCYSAQTVFQWARLAFTGVVKSLGFCVLLEGVMVASKTHWLGLAALLYLVAINGIATGCTISLGPTKRSKTAA
jgi:hypothetical protein